ncbi:hypothetical protein ERC79_01320 [Rhodococcus sp. ABRD24]|uniref:hypothetical protein n=1 Tax=Rhodococcus sp. ABRD24 TaxID=2507582 RepID=UPI00103F1A20|nr:hypothetical protein [Rhodococcus sp. ABRD24]QBJ94754.1 hypothetical protein ERC79_01320 [Rhodococcus sp. ABRD24]
MSFWAWLADVANGPVGGAVVALGGVTLTQRSNRMDKRRDREVAVEDKLREEVAGLLVLRVKTLDMQRDLGIQSAEAMQRLDDTSTEATTGRLRSLVTMRDNYIEHVEGLRDRALRISFLTREPRLTEALDRLRALTYGDWSLPMKPLHARGPDKWSTSWQRLETLRADTNSAFEEVEEATRALVVSHGGVNAPGGSVVKFRRPRKPRTTRPEAVDEQAG